MSDQARPPAAAKRRPRKQAAKKKPASARAAAPQSGSKAGPKAGDTPARTRKAAAKTTAKAAARGAGKATAKKDAGRATPTPAAKQQPDGKQAGGAPQAAGPAATHPARTSPPAAAAPPRASAGNGQSGGSRAAAASGHSTAPGTAGPGPTAGTAPGRHPASDSLPATGWRGHWHHWRQRADPWLRLCRLDRPIGYLLLLWPTWWALWAAAEGFPPFGPLLIFTLGVVVMRSAGCVINDYADRWLDGQVERTRQRPLATGEVTPRQALALFAGLLLAALLLVLMTNPLTIKLSVIGAGLAAGYPFLKRYTHLPQIWLGMAFGWAIPMAFAAVTGSVPKLAWLLFIANILWATAYDTFYAMVDREDDIRMGAKSTAILLGDMDLVGIALMQGGFLLAMYFAGQQLQLGGPWLTALAISLLLVGHQLWQARHRERDACFKAFLDNNRVGLVLFVGLVAGLATR